MELYGPLFGRSVVNYKRVNFSILEFKCGDEVFGATFPSLSGTHQETTLVQLLPFHENQATNMMLKFTINLHCPGGGGGCT